MTDPVLTEAAGEQDREGRVLRAETAESATWRRRLLHLVMRLTLGLGLAVLLLYYTLKANRTSLGAVLGGVSWPLLAAAVVLYGLVILITAVRWDLLLRIQGIRLHPWEVVRLTMIGVFFNLAIPGAVGGDLVKMAFVARRAHRRRAEAILTVLLDRIVGLVALFLVSAVLVLVFLPVLHPLTRRFPEVALGAYLVGAGSIAGLAGMGLVEFRERLIRHPLLARLLAFAERWTPALVVAMVQRVVVTIEACRRDRRRILAAFALASLVHIFLGADLILVGRAVGERDVSATGYLLAMQVGNAAGAVPVTPSGLGARDAVVARFLFAFGGRQDLCGGIPVVMSMIIVFWSMVGAVIFVFSRGVRQVWIDEVRHGEREPAEGAGT